MPLKFVTVPTTVENGTVTGPIVESTAPTPSTFVPGSVTDGPAGSSMSLEFTDEATYDLDQILYDIRRDNSEISLVMKTVNQNSEEERILRLCLEELLVQYSPSTIFTTSLTSGINTVSLEGTNLTTDNLFSGQALKKVVNIPVGTQWFDKQIDTLYISTIVGTWSGATSIVLPIAQPAGAPTIGARWFEKTTDTLYTAIATWVGSTGVSIPVVQPSVVPLIGARWFDEQLDVLYTATTAGTWSNSNASIIKVIKPSSPKIGDRWFDEMTDTLYTATADGTWVGANEALIPTTRPSVSPAIGDRWFDKINNALFTAKTAGTWVGATATPSIPSSQPSTAPTALSLWFDKVENKLYSPVGTWTSALIQILPVVRPESISNTGSFAQGSKISSIVDGKNFTTTLDHTATGSVQFRIFLDNTLAIPNFSDILKARYEAKLIEENIGVEDSEMEEGELLINVTQPKIGTTKSDMAKYLLDETKKTNSTPIINLNRPLVLWTDLGDGDLNVSEDFPYFDNLNNEILNLQAEIDANDGGDFEIEDLDGGQFDSTYEEEENGGGF
jgi:hypothetical protein